MKKPWYLNIWIWIIIGIIALSVPFCINKAYRSQNPIYFTEWEAADALSFYGTFLSFAGSVVLGLVAVDQSRKANLFSEKMLDIEERQEMPVLDILEIADGQVPANKDALRHALQLMINNCFYFIKEDNTLGETNTSVVVFALKNISDNHIISMNVTGLTNTTSFYNGKCISSKAHVIEYNGGVRVFGSGDSQFLVIGGVEFEYPPGLSDEERFEQNYCNPTSLLEFCFILRNARGRKYEEKIRIRIAYIPNENLMNYPCIVEKEIISILPIKDK